MKNSNSIEKLNKSLTEEVKNLPLGTRMAIYDFKNELQRQKMLDKIDSLEKDIEIYKESFSFKINVMLWVLSALTLMVALFKFLG